MNLNSRQSLRNCCGKQPSADGRPACDRLVSSRFSRSLKPALLTEHRNSITTIANPKILGFLILFAACFVFASKCNAQSVSLAKAPKLLEPGKEFQLTLESNYGVSGIVQAQLFDAEWNRITEKWSEVESGKQLSHLNVTVPAGTKDGRGYFWQILLYDSKWTKKADLIVKTEVGNGVVMPVAQPELKPSPKPNLDDQPEKSKFDAADRGNASQWTPEGDWVIDWQDEFNGTGLPENWYPFLGYTPEEFTNKKEKGLRWNGATEETSQMYSSKRGQHWLNGKGQLVLQISTDKAASNANGTKVDAAYLMTGYPEKWDDSEPTNVKWGGKFFSPAKSPHYICARIKTDNLKGHSTWFAFWLFSKTRSYNGTPADGTEVDIVEIPKGKKDYINKAFNVANHWAKKEGSDSLQLNGASNPKSTDLVDVNDDRYHTYGVEWTKTYMKCYVDGKLYKTFTDHIPSDPVDMMLLLTWEYQLTAWDPGQGDGRTEGPFVSEDESRRVMSRVIVDYVRCYVKK